MPKTQTGTGSLATGLEALPTAGRRRVLTWTAGAGAALLGAAIGAGQSAPRVGAQQAAGIVGSWLVTTERQPNLLTFAADGNLIGSNPPFQPAPPGASTQSLSVTTAHGVWDSSGGQAFAFTFLELEYDLQAQLWATTKISGTITLNDAGDAGGGLYMITVMDPSGQVVHRDRGALQLTRIQLEPAG